MSVENFWESKHRASDKMWLSGSTQEHIELYHGWFPKDSIVTEIGVGLGTVTLPMLRRGNRVSAVDICRRALSRVRSLALAEGIDLSRVPCYLSEDVHKAEPADVVLMHCVAQHVDDPELLRILREAKLREKGFFSVQQTYLKSHDGLERSLAAPEKMSYHRSREHLLAIIDKAGLEVFKERNFPVPDGISHRVVRAH